MAFGDERGKSMRGESMPQESPENDMKNQVLDMLQEKLDTVRQVGGITGKAVAPRYEQLIKDVEADHPGALEEAAKEVGLGTTEKGEQGLRSAGMEGKEISEDEKRRIEESLGR
jgi:hypothetical protein